MIPHPSKDAIVTLTADEKSEVTSAFLVTKKIIDYEVNKQETPVAILRTPALPFLYLLGKVQAGKNNAKIKVAE